MNENIMNEEMVVETMEAVTGMNKTVKVVAAAGLATLAVGVAYKKVIEPKIVKPVIAKIKGKKNKDEAEDVVEATAETYDCAEEETK